MNETNTPRPIAPLPPYKPLTDEQIARLRAAAGSRKDDHEYMESGRQQVAEYRRQLQEEWEREHGNGEPPIPSAPFPPPKGERGSQRARVQNRRLRGKPCDNALDELPLSPFGGGKGAEGIGGNLAVYAL